jgi:hypothetical protein
MSEGKHYFQGQDPDRKLAIIIFELRPSQGLNEDMNEQE